MMLTTSYYYRKHSKKHPSARVRWCFRKTLVGHGIGEFFHGVPQIFHCRNSDNRRLAELGQWSICGFGARVGLW